MLGFLFKPRPYPAFVLLAIIITIFGVMAIVKISVIAGAVLIAAALVLLVSFIRGLKQDLEVSRIGITTTVRITRVEQQGGTYRGEHYDVWQVHYTFQDRQGVTHEDVMPLDDRAEAKKYHPGGTAQLRYHPDNPSIFRWIG